MNATILTTDNIASFLNTGTEVLAEIPQTIVSPWLILGIGEQAEMLRIEAPLLLAPDQIDRCTVQANPIYLALPNDLLLELVTNHTWVICD